MALKSGLGRGRIRLLRYPSFDCEKGRVLGRRKPCTSEQATDVYALILIIPKHWQPCFDYESLVYGGMGTYEKQNEIMGWETLGAVHANYEMFRFSSTDL